MFSSFALFLSFLVERGNPTERERSSHIDDAQARRQQQESSCSSSGRLKKEKQRSEESSRKMAHQEQPGTPGSFERDSLFKRLRAKPENKV